MVWELSISVGKGGTGPLARMSRPGTSVTGWMEFFEGGLAGEDGGEAELAVEAEAMMDGGAAEVGVDRAGRGYRAGRGRRRDCWRRWSCLRMAWRWCRG